MTDFRKCLTSGNIILLLHVQIQQTKIFSTNELHLILKRSNLQICEHSSLFKLLTKLSFKTNLKFRKLKLSKFSNYLVLQLIFSNISFLSSDNYKK